MARRKQDAIIETIEHALEFGSLIRYGQSWDFVRDLNEVREMIEPVIASDPTRALTLLEAFITGCYEKSEELDDSSGMFGQLVGSLFCDWIRARQSAGSDRAETAARLLDWMTHDDYGYCHRLEEDAAKVLDKPGLKAFADAAQATMAATASADPDSWRRRQLLDVIKAIHAQVRDVEAYAAACNEAGEVTPKDCEVLASMCLSRRRPADALGWAERGLACKGDGWSYGLRLPELKRKALQRLGRSDEAVNDAWADYAAQPAVHTYEALVALVPKADRAEWRAKALGELDGNRSNGLWHRLAQGARSAGRCRLGCGTRATGRDQSLHHGKRGKAATQEPPRAGGAAECGDGVACRGCRQVAVLRRRAGQPEKARNLLRANGGETEWNDLVQEIGTRHSRKSGFMPGFNRIAGNQRQAPAKRKPSLAERARKQWKKRGGRGTSEP